MPQERRRPGVYMSRSEDDMHGRAHAHVGGAARTHSHALAHTRTMPAAGGGGRKSPARWRQVQGCAPYWSRNAFKVHSSQAHSLSASVSLSRCFSLSVSFLSCALWLGAYMFGCVQKPPPQQKEGGKKSRGIVLFARIRGCFSLLLN